MRGVNKIIFLLTHCLFCFILRRFTPRQKVAWTTFLKDLTSKRI